MWKTFIKESAPIAISSLGISMYTFIGPTVLKYARGDIEVGIYTAGYKLISILALIPMTISQVVYPIFSDFFANAKEKLAKSLADVLRIVLVIALPLAMGVVLLAPKFFSLLFPPTFDAGVVVLQLTIVGNIFGYMDWIIYAFLLAVDRQKFMMQLSISIGIGTLIVGMLFVPQFGFNALPWIQMSVEFSLFLVQVWYLIRIGYWSSPFTTILKPLLATIVMGIIIFLMIQFNLFLLIGVGGILYLGIVYVLKGFGEQETQILRVTMGWVSMNRL
jgi:O-antigen/teichoic acid export membrane protein